MSKLFEPLRLCGVDFPNRAWVSPMCQYSADEGHATDWHLVHLGSLARGGAGLVCQEATAVSPEARLTVGDAGLWCDSQVDGYRRIARFISEQGAVPGIQLAHNGRKASIRRPWEGRGSLPEVEGGWQTIAPSAVAFDDYAKPREMTRQDIASVVQLFSDAACRALDCGFEFIELHGAHGYLIHEFLSPLSNFRDDEFGGTLENRLRFLRQVVTAVRGAWPDDKPMSVRISATDWADGGLDLEETVQVAALLGELGVNIIDVSSGGLVAHQRVDTGPGYQVGLAAAIKRATGLPVGAVGMITEPAQAETIVASGCADVVFLAREMLRDPHWPLRAAAELGAEIRWPDQYLRARSTRRT